MKTYTELISYPTYAQRLEYLKLENTAFAETFGTERYLNQVFYRSPEWKRVRDYCIVRDNGCDLAIDGIQIYGKILVHHINPITIEDIDSVSSKLFDPENLITVSHETHNQIHYGYTKKEGPGILERVPNDTIPWK